MADFTHFNENGRAKMVDVSEKADTVRTAVAAGRVLVNAETFELIKTGGMKKGDVLNVAQVGGIKPACARYQKLVVTCKQGVFHHDLIELIGINLCRAEHVNKTVTEAASFAFKKRCDNKRIFAVCEIALFFYSAAVLKLHSARKLDHMNTVFPCFGIVFTQPAFD